MTCLDPVKAQLTWGQPPPFRATASGCFQTDLVIVPVGAVLTNRMLTSNCLMIIQVVSSSDRKEGDD